jgi:hypothetical protein
MPQKPILVPTRLRRPPATGWSWMDRLFVREHMAHLSREAVLLYFFLKNGLSFYADSTLATLLRMTLPALIKARNELRALELATYDAAYVENLLLAERRRRESPTPTLPTPRRRELIDEIELDPTDPALYDRFCNDTEED